MVKAAVSSPDVFLVACPKGNAPAFERSVCRYARLFSLGTKSPYILVFDLAEESCQSPYGSHLTEEALTATASARSGLPIYVLDY